MELEEWNRFIALAPYDAAYLKESFAVAVRHGVKLICYGAHQQYANSEFDGKQILANKTVVPGPDGLPQRNFRFWEWYRELMDLYEKGDFGKPE